MSILVSKRLLLTKYEEPKHLTTMVRWLNDPDVVRFSEQRHHRHDEESQALFIADGPDLFREIHTENRFIGTIAAYVDRGNSVANVGILIGEKKEWGKGYGTEAWKSFCDHLLTHGIRKIEAGTMACNFGMLNIFRRTGMFYEGQLVDHFVLNNKTFSLLQWARIA